jgi:small subunit ribosomal protein S21
MEDAEVGELEFMNGVFVKETEVFERAVKRFSKVCERAGLVSDIKKNRYFEKPSETRKRAKNAAKRKQIREDRRKTWTPR